MSHPSRHTILSAIWEMSIMLINSIHQLLDSRMRFFPYSSSSTRSGTKKSSSSTLPDLLKRTRQHFREHRMTRDIKQIPQTRQQQKKARKQKEEEGTRSSIRTSKRQDSRRGNKKAQQEGRRKKQNKCGSKKQGA